MFTSSRNLRGYSVKKASKGIFLSLLATREFTQVPFFRLRRVIHKSCVFATGLENLAVADLPVASADTEFIVEF